jgi:hypothetical protein
MKVYREPITPAALLRTVVDPTLAQMAAFNGIPTDDRARVLLLAICGQETNYNWRHQVVAGGNAGPAMGRWQFERAGGVAGVMTHRSSANVARFWADRFDIEFTSYAIHPALAWFDDLALAYARLLLYTDPLPLPEVDDAFGGWTYYLRNWRPGKPHPTVWPGHHAVAVATVSNKRKDDL